MLTYDKKQTLSAVSLNPLATHWRGRCALLPTLLFTGISLRIFLGWVQHSVPVSQLALWILFTLVVFLWQVGGMSRATDVFLKNTGNVLVVFAGYFCILVIAVLSLLQVLDALALKYRIETPFAEAYTLPVMSEEKLVRVEGNLDWELFGAFEKTLQDNPDIKNVRLGSVGGYVFVARAMALMILEKKMNTHVETHCYSACTVAFLAGQRRTMSASAELGFHQYKLEKSNTPALIDVSKELERDREFFAEQGLSDGFIQQVFAADHSELWVPDTKSLLAAGVLVH